MNISDKSTNSTTTWQAIAKRKLTDVEKLQNEYYLKLILLDKYLEYILQHKFDEPTLKLCQILMKHRPEMSQADVNSIFLAHKVRNAFAHEIEFDADTSKLQKAVNRLHFYCHFYCK